MKLDRALVVGDLQLESKWLSIKAEILFEILESLDLQHVVLLGDLLELRGKIEAECLNYLVNKFKASNKHFTILVGNHDLISLHGKETALHPLKELENVTLVDEPMVIDGVAFVPYIHDLDALKAALSRPDIKACKTLFAHLDVLGMDYGNGVLAQKGLDLPFLLNNFKLTVSGHFHKFNDVSNSKGRFTYLGTPYACDWGEANQDKFIATFDKASNSLELIATNEFFPQYTSITYDCDLDATTKSVPNWNSLLNNDDFFRIILKGHPDNIGTVKKDLLGYNFTRVSIREQPTSQDGREAVLTENMSHEQMFETYCDNIAKLDRPIVEAGLEILRGIS